MKTTQVQNVYRINEIIHKSALRPVTIFLIAYILICPSCKSKQHSPAPLENISIAESLMPDHHYKIAVANKSTAEHYVLVDMIVISDSVTKKLRVASSTGHLSYLIANEYRDQNDGSLYEGNGYEFRDSLLYEGFKRGFSFSSQYAVDYYIKNEYHSEEEYQQLKAIAPELILGEGGTVGELNTLFNNPAYTARYFIESGALPRGGCMGPVYITASYPIRYSH